MCVCETRRGATAGCECSSGFVFLPLRTDVIRLEKDFFVLWNKRQSNPQLPKDWLPRVEQVAPCVCADVCACPRDPSEQPCFCPHTVCPAFPVRFIFSHLILSHPDLTNLTSPSLHSLLTTSLSTLFLFLSALFLGCLSLVSSVCRRPRVDCSETASPAPVCQACLEKKFRGSLSGTSAKAGRGQSKVVTFWGVTEFERPVGKAMAGEGEESGLLRRLLSKATVAMPTIGLKVSQLSEREGRYERGPSLIASVACQPRPILIRFLKGSCLFAPAFNWKQ